MKKLKTWVAAFFAAGIVGLASCQNKNSSSQPTTPSEEIVEHTITIDNTTGEADSQFVVNGLHVYDRDSEEMDDYVSGAKVKHGHKIGVFVYNQASAVSFTMKHGDEPLVERLYRKCYWDDDDSKVEHFDFNLTGDLIVTAKVAEEPIKTYKVTTTGLTKDLNVAYNSRKGEELSPVTDSVKKGFNLLAMISNSADFAYHIDATIKGKPYDLGEFNKVKAKEGGEDGAGGFMIPASAIDGDVAIKFSAQYAIKVTGATEGLTVLMKGELGEELADVSDSILAGYNLKAMIINPTTSKYTISVTIGGKALDIAPFNVVLPKEGDDDGMGGFMIKTDDITGNVVIDIQKAA